VSGREERDRRVESAKADAAAGGATRRGVGGKLSGKVALVTGSTGGVGAATARLFALEGASVAVSGRREGAGEGVIGRIAAEGVPRERLAFFRADLADPRSCRALVASVAGRFGGLDVLVNNAADFSRGTLLGTGVDLWDRHMALNLRAPFVLTQAAVPPMGARGGGSIVNVGSINAYLGEANLLSYSVSKGGLTTLTKNAAQQLNRFRIRVNQLNLGWTETEGEHRVQMEETGREDWLEVAERTRPFGRLFAPEEAARAVLFFASSDSSLATGSVLDLEQFPVGSLQQQVAPGFGSPGLGEPGPGDPGADGAAAAAGGPGYRDGQREAGGKGG